MVNWGWFVSLTKSVCLQRTLRLVTSWQQVLHAFFLTADWTCAVPTQGQRLVKFSIWLVVFFFSSLYHQQSGKQPFETSRLQNTLLNVTSFGRWSLWLEIFYYFPSYQLENNETSLTSIPLDTPVTRPLYGQPAHKEPFIKQDLKTDGWSHSKICADESSKP